MKNFKEPVLEVSKFDIEDVLMTASDPNAEEDEGPFRPFSTDIIGELLGK